MYLLFFKFEIFIGLSEGLFIGINWVLKFWVILMLFWVKFWFIGFLLVFKFCRGVLVVIVEFVINNVILKILGLCLKVFYISFIIFLLIFILI